MSNHLRFDKYTSIENTYQVNYMLNVKEQVPADMIYDVTEKVHGANCCLITDGNIVEFAKRSAIVGGNDSFFRHDIILAEHQERILNAFNYIKEKYSTDERPVVMVQFYGELFGGAYPHPDVPRNNLYGSVQKGIYYAPYQSFYGFDIAVCYGDKIDGVNYRTWLNPDQMAEVYSMFNIFYAKSLFRGTLTECLQFSNLFQSHIPEWLGLPPIEDNTCEGVVIKPMIPSFFKNGDRIVMKNKNEKFSEKKNEKVHKEVHDLPDTIITLIDEISSYINDQRLCNVISHEGEFDMPKDFGKCIKLFTEDIMNDFVKDNLSAWTGLEKANQKIITKEMNHKASMVIKDHFNIH